MVIIKPGETQRFSCKECQTEWDITYEPKTVGNPKEQIAIKPIPLKYCPACGGSPDEDD